MSSTKSRILVVDDHPIVLEGYRELIDRQPDLMVCGSASTASEALEMVTETSPHLAVVDLMLKESNGLDLVKDLHSRFPEIRLLVVSARDEYVFAERVMRAGASGYLSKEEAIAKLISAIRDVLDGKISLSPDLTRRLLERVVSASDSHDVSPVACLADRELETFELIGKGLTTREIAAQMQLSPKTVDRYRENIKEKLHLSNANELLRRATLWDEEQG